MIQVVDCKTCNGKPANELSPKIKVEAENIWGAAQFCLSFALCRPVDDAKSTPLPSRRRKPPRWWGVAGPVMSGIATQSPTAGRYHGR